MIPAGPSTRHTRRLSSLVSPSLTTANNATSTVGSVPWLEDGADEDRILEAVDGWLAANAASRRSSSDAVEEQKQRTNRAIQKETGGSSHRASLGQHQRTSRINPSDERPRRCTPCTGPATGTSGSSVTSRTKLTFDNFECPICLQLLHLPVATRCGHHFCFHCVFGRVTACPLCRAAFPCDDAPLSEVSTAVTTLMRIHVHPRALAARAADATRRGLLSPRAAVGAFAAARASVSFASSSATIPTTGERAAATSTQRALALIVPPAPDEGIPDSQKMYFRGGMMHRRAPSLVTPKDVERFNELENVNARSHNLPPHGDDDDEDADSGVTGPAVGLRRRSSGHPRPARSHHSGASAVLRITDRPSPLTSDGRGFPAEDISWDATPRQNAPLRIRSGEQQRPARVLPASVPQPQTSAVLGSRLQSQLLRRLAQEHGQSQRILPPPTIERIVSFAETPRARVEHGGEEAGTPPGVLRRRRGDGAQLSSQPPRNANAGVGDEDSDDDALLRGMRLAVKRASVSCAALARAADKTKPAASLASANNAKRERRLAAGVGNKTDDDDDGDDGLTNAMQALRQRCALAPVSRGATVKKTTFAESRQRLSSFPAQLLSSLVAQKSSCGL